MISIVKHLRSYMIMDPLTMFSIFMLFDTRTRLPLHRIFNPFAIPDNQEVAL